MKKKRNNRRQTAPEHTPKKPDRQAIGLLLLLVAVTLLVFGTYRFFVQQEYFRIVMIIYMAVFTGFILAYVLYNRGFSRKGVTKDMLPTEWSEEEKTAFVEDGERRAKRSRWLLIPILAFLFTFGMDAIELFVLPFFEGLFA